MPCDAKVSIKFSYFVKRFWVVLVKLLLFLKHVSKVFIVVRIHYLIPIHALRFSAQSLYFELNWIDWIELNWLNWIDLMITDSETQNG
jgi:hypothetical protein